MQVFSTLALVGQINVFSVSPLSTVRCVLEPLRPGVRDGFHLLDSFIFRDC
jgi:hypothetical protein